MTVAIGQLNVDLHVGDEFDRENVKVVVFEGFLLPTGGVQILTKIAFLIEQSDADERQAKVARGL